MISLKDKDNLEQTIVRNHILWMIKNGRYPCIYILVFSEAALSFGILISCLIKNQYKALLQSFPNMGAAFQRRRMAVIKVKNRD